MRTFAQAPKTTPQATSVQPGRRGRINFGQSGDANSSLNLPHIIVNQAALRLSEANKVHGEGDSATAQIDHFAHDFSRIPVHANGPIRLQTKLTVNAPGDVYEQEADRIADQMMAMPAFTTVRGAPPRIQRVSGPANGHMDAAPASVDQVLASPGSPLEPSLRQDMERCFDHDFSQVRVHSGPLAEQSAREVRAAAYTVGRHVVFGSGSYAPQTTDGKRLLAHELVHTLQQGNAEIGLLARAPRTVAEIDAEIRAADALRRQARDNALRILRETGRDVSGTVRRRPGSARRGTPGRHLGEILADALEGIMGDESLPDGTRRAAQQVRNELEELDSLLERLGKERARAPAARQTYAGPKQNIEPPPKSRTTLPAKEPPGKKLPPAPSASGEVTVPQRGSGTPAIAQGGTRPSGLRTAGRFLAREAPGLLLQLALMALFPPGVNIGNHKAGELSRTNLDPAVHDALAKQQPVLDKLLAADPSKSIYANVTARLDYGVDASRHGDLELSLKDITFLDMKITNEHVALSDPKFKQTASRTVAKQITYSILLYEPEHVTRNKERLRAEQEKAEYERLRRQREADDAGWQRGFKQ